MISYSRERQFKPIEDRKQFFFDDDVIACVRNAQAIVILGPRAAQGEFRKRVAQQKFTGHVAELKTAAKLTDEQISDFVRQHYQ